MNHKEYTLVFPAEAAKIFLEVAFRSETCDTVSLGKVFPGIF